MKRKLLTLLMFFGVVIPCYGQTTPNLHLQLPARGALNWDTAINGNSILIDTWVGTLQIYKGTWNSGTVYASGQIVGYGGTLYSSLVGSNFNNIPSSSPTQWVSMIGGTISGGTTGALVTYTGSSSIGTSILSQSTSSSLSTLTYAHPSGGGVSCAFSLDSSGTDPFTLNCGGSGMALQDSILYIGVTSPSSTTSAIAIQNLSGNMNLSVGTPGTNFTFAGASSLVTQNNIACAGWGANNDVLCATSAGFVQYINGSSTPLTLLSGGGTTNSVPVYTGAHTLGNSSIIDSSGTLTSSDNTLTFGLGNTGSTTVNFGDPSGISGNAVFNIWSGASGLFQVQVASGGPALLYAGGNGIEDSDVWMGLSVQASCGSGASGFDLLCGTSSGVKQSINGGSFNSFVPQFSASLGTAAQLPVMNAGGTLFTPVNISGDASLASTGALTVTGVNGLAVPTSAEVTTTNSSGQFVKGHTLYFGTTEVTVTNLKIVPANVIGLTSGNNDLYTVPVGKMALIVDALATNPAATSVTIQCQAQIKISGTYVNYDFLTSTVNTSPTYGHQGALLPMLANAGEVWGVNCDNAGLSIWPLIYEFDSTSLLARSLVSTALGTLGSGNTTVFTAPANGVQFIPFIASGNGNLLRGSLFYYNNSGVNRTVKWNIVPNGGSVADANQIFSSSLVSFPNATTGSMPYFGGMGSGDFISINLDASTAIQTAFVIYRTLP